MDRTEMQLSEYFNRAADLAETLKNDIKKGNNITDKTVLALNEFIIAANAIADLTLELEKRAMRLN